MNKLILLFGVLICFIAVHARHYDRAEESEDQESLLKPKEHISGHRRRRWQSSYGYDYPPPSFYYERRDDRYSQDIQNIYRLLEDISNYIRRTPPPPPQPIYIPFPVAFNRPSCNTPQKNTSDQPIPLNRNTFTENMDQNRNWGFVTSEEDFPVDENDGARPISFEPLVPRQLMKRPAPPVEHGTQQGHATVAPRFPAPAAFSSPVKNVAPGMCNAAILSCCGISGDTAKQTMCFANVGCAGSYDSSSCTPASIQRALDSFKLAYSPKEQ